MQSQSDSVEENGFGVEAVLVPEPTLLEPPGPLAPLPGEILRKAREERGEALNDVARILKLSAHQLEALENGRYDVLPGPTFVRGFLRNYANHLGIPPDPLLEGISARTPTAADLASMLKLDGNVQPAASPRPRSGVLPVALIVLAVALALAGLVVAGIKLKWFGGFRFGGAMAASVHEKSPVAAPAHGKLPVVALAQEKLPATPPAPEKLPAAVPAPEAAPVQEKLPVPAPVREKHVKFETQTITLAPPVPVNIAPESANAPPLGSGEQAIATDQAQAGPPLPEVGTLRVSFNASTLAQVRDNSGKLIFTRIGTKGSSSSVKGKPPFSVMIKQANNVKLEYNGQSVDLKGHANKDGIARLILQ